MAKDGWRRAALGQVLVESRHRIAVDGDGVYPIAGVYGFGRGVLLRESVRGSELLGSYLYQISAGQLIYSRLKAFEGAFALVPRTAHHRYVSNEFPTFDVDQERALPEFIALVLGMPRTWRELTERIIGMGARRERLQVPEFLQFEIDLPPVEEQRAVVEAVDAIDTVRRSHEAEISATRALAAALRERAIARSRAPLVPLGDLVHDIEGGKSPRCLDRPPGPDEWGVLKLSAVRAGLFHDAEAKALPADVPPFSEAEVQAGDVIITRSNTRGLVGAVCRVSATRPRLLLCDLTWRLHPKLERVNPDYLVLALTSRVARRQIEDRATGTSESMTKVSKRALREVIIPIPPLAEQAQLGAQILPVMGAASAVEAEQAALFIMRRAMAHALLFGHSGVARTKSDLLVSA